MHLVRLLATVVVVALSTALAGPAEAAVWRVLEALGEVRTQGALEARWQPVVAGRSLGGVQQVVTGPSGRTILAAGPLSLGIEAGSRVVLPQEGNEVLQEQGRVRYRAAGPARVLTPQGAVLLDRAVIELVVEGETTELQVLEGSARLRQGNAERVLAEGARETFRAGAPPAEAPVVEVPMLVEAPMVDVPPPVREAPVAAPAPAEPPPARAAAAMEPAPGTSAPEAPAPGAPIPLFPEQR